MMERRRRERDVLGRLLQARSAINDAVLYRRDFPRFIRTLGWHSLGFGASRCRKPTEDVGAPGSGAPLLTPAFETGLHSRPSISLGVPAICPYI